MNRAEAFAFRRKIEAAATKFTDEEALNSLELFQKWGFRDYQKGDRVVEGTVLYKAKQNITANPTWLPSLTPALWEPVALPSEAGTIDNPITAVAGMEYEIGKYYIENDKVYLCERSGMNKGDKIVLQYLPSALVGHYFTEVSI